MSNKTKQFDCNGCNEVANNMYENPGHFQFAKCPECSSSLKLVRCKGCEAVEVTDNKPSYHPWWRTDHYDIPTGHWCDSCYNDDHKYTYKRGAYYDYMEAGEYLESQDY